jgi:rare lipoprotein A
MKKIIVLIAILGAFAAHYHVNGLKANPHNRVITAPKTHTCIASWYGQKYAGRVTASGSIFNPMELVAAHKTLPFGTRLLVENGPNNVFVTITDRGPFIKGRELDLSLAAFERLAQKEAGLIQVTYKVLH